MSGCEGNYALSGYVVPSEVKPVHLFFPFLHAKKGFLVKMYKPTDLDESDFMHLVPV
jgi:hypothetical protein